jgi:hypothetical protein
VGLPAAVPQLPEYPAIVTVHGIGDPGERGDTVVSEQLDVVGIRGGMNGGRLCDDEGASAGGPRFMVCDEVRVGETVAQHARHVTCREDSVAQPYAADLNRLEEIREKGGQGGHSSLSKCLIFVGSPAGFNQKEPST